MCQGLHGWYNRRLEYLRLSEDERYVEHAAKIRELTENSNKKELMRTTPPLVDCPLAAGCSWGHAGHSQHHASEFIASAGAEFIDRIEEQLMYEFKQHRNDDTPLLDPYEKPSTVENEFAAAAEQGSFGSKESGMAQRFRRDVPIGDRGSSKDEKAEIIKKWAEGKYETCKQERIKKQKVTQKTWDINKLLPLDRIIHLEGGKDNQKNVEAAMKIARFDDGFKLSFLNECAF